MEGSDVPPSEVAQLGRLRFWAGVVILGLIVFLALTDTIGKVLLSPSFNVSDVIFGSLLGALLLVIGIEVWSRWPYLGPK